MTMNYKETHATLARVKAATEELVEVQKALEVHIIREAWVWTGTSLSYLPCPLLTTVRF